MLKFKSGSGNFGILAKSGDAVDALKEGTKIEKEHTGTYKKIKAYYDKHKKFPPDKMVFGWIAGDHIGEKKNYYKLVKKHIEKSQSGLFIDLVKSDKIKKETRLVLGIKKNK